MARVKTLLASVAAMGLVFAGPALAATRAHDALPSATSISDLSRGAAPMTDANAANRRPTLLLILFAALFIGGLIIALSSGGGHNDSPG
jgi:hypothetical protein